MPPGLVYLSILYHDETLNFKIMPCHNYNTLSFILYIYIYYIFISLYYLCLFHFLNSSHYFKRNRFFHKFPINDLTVNYLNFPIYACSQNKQKKNRSSSKECYDRMNGTIFASEFHIQKILKLVDALSRNI